MDAEKSSKCHCRLIIEVKNEEELVTQKQSHNHEINVNGGRLKNFRASLKQAVVNEGTLHEIYEKIELE